ncbi:MAG: imidazole glycerol phosphate synthase cyclase subunit, partial [Balneolales bacterium]|nr:imidazole glycerol phosphate synthase cyclase subunit [Balneolales bacterium]
ISREISIPFTVGGGIRSVEEIAYLLHAGADKVSLNSSIVRDPDLITRAADSFGSQCIVAALDAKKTGNSWNIFVKAGTEDTGIDAIEWATEVYNRGAGEILLTSMDRDGTKSGFDVELLQIISKKVPIPLVASGGAGTIQHCIDAILIGKADAVLAASIFHFKEIEIEHLKLAMAEAGLPVRMK